MADKSVREGVVEVISAFTVGGTRLKPGTRLLAWQSGGGWRLIFNGHEVLAPPGSVGAVDSPEVQVAAEKRSAREEEYQDAPPPGAPPGTTKPG